jgi:hypothetical protein
MVKISKGVRATAYKLQTDYGKLNELNSFGTKTYKTWNFEGVTSVNLSAF